MPVLFFAFIHLVQDLRIFSFILVQDSIFTSCTRSNIINSSNETQQHTKEQPDQPKASTNFKPYTCE